MTKKIALIVSGKLSAEVSETYGDYTVVFTEFLQRSLPAVAGDHDNKFTLDAYDVAEKLEYPSDEQLDTYDALLYTGSAASAYMDIDWINKLVAFTARVINDKPKIKILGICFGHQIISRALGGRCVFNNGLWEVGPTPIDLTDLGKKLFGVETLNLQQMHRDHVPEVPTGYHLLGSTSTSYNQGFVGFLPGTETGPSVEKDLSLDKIHVWTVQGHPEFVEGIVSGIVKDRVKNGVMSPEVGEDAERRKNWRNDGVTVVGRALWSILGVSA